MEQHNDHPDYQARIDAACRFLEEHLDNDPPLEDIANAAHFSPFHFHRLFRGLTGETVRGYTRRLRLERAAHHLTHSDKDILAIALDAGYASHEAFTRAFTKRFDATPSAFRQAKQDALAPIRRADQAPPIDVRLERMPPTTIAFARHVGPYTEVGAAWKILMKWGWSRMVFAKARTFGLCHDDPDATDPSRIRYDACMIVPAGTKTKHGVQLRELPGSTYAVTLHQGPYSLLGETYAALLAHIALHKIDGRARRLRDPPSLEQYLNDPRKTKPEDLRTEIWMPVH
jgi:AraC family transcriptional regulator